MAANPFGALDLSDDDDDDTGTAVKAVTKTKEEPKPKAAKAKADTKPAAARSELWCEATPPSLGAQKREETVASG